MSRIEPMPNSQPARTTLLWGENLVEAFTGFEYEARANVRTKLTVEIDVRASNGRGNVFGTPFKAVSTDISAGGIGFLHTAAVPDKFLAITLNQNGQKFFILVEVVRCRSVGNLYEIGTQFISQLQGVES